MGYQTDYVGHLRIHPPLNEAETTIINHVAGRWRDGRSATPGPRVIDELEVATNVLRERAPRGWSNWVVSSRCRDCLAYDGGDKANHMIPWLRFLIDTFLGSDAAASGAAVPEAAGLDGLTRDHLLNGVVVGCRRDTGELFAIVVTDNHVEVELMWEGDPEWSDYPRLAYQVEIDRRREWAREDRRTSRPRYDRAW